MDIHHPFRSFEAKQEYLTHYDNLTKQWPTPSQTRMVSTSFGQTFMRIQGPAAGQPLMLLPGDTETSLSWSPVIEALSNAYRTFAIDLIYDNGRSVSSREISNPHDFVDWLDELTNELGLEHLNLMGYSYGGWQAALYALSHPDRIRRLVLLAPAATVLSPGPWLLARAIVYHFLPFRLVASNYFYWYGPDAVRNKPVRKRIDEMVEEDLLARRCFRKRKFVLPTRLTDADWESLRVPTLFLAGENERTYPARQAMQRLHQVAPQVEVKIAAHTDHYLLLVNPDWVVQSTLRFLQS